MTWTGCGPTLIYRTKASPPGLLWGALGMQFEIVIRVCYGTTAVVRENLTMTPPAFSAATRTRR